VCEADAHRWAGTASRRAGRSERARSRRADGCVKRAVRISVDERDTGARRSSARTRAISRRPRRRRRRAWLSRRIKRRATSFIASLADRLLALTEYVAPGASTAIPRSGCCLSCARSCSMGRAVADPPQNAGAAVRRGADGRSAIVGAIPREHGLRARSARPTREALAEMEIARRDIAPIGSRSSS
jgi:hypothetical protein